MHSITIQNVFLHFSKAKFAFALVYMTAFCVYVPNILLLLHGEPLLTVIRLSYLSEMQFAIAFIGICMILILPPMYIYERWIAQWLTRHKFDENSMLVALSMLIIPIATIALTVIMFFIYMHSL